MNSAVKKYFLQSRTCGEGYSRQKGNNVNHPFKSIIHKFCDILLITIILVKNRNPIIDEDNQQQLVFLDIQEKKTLIIIIIEYIRKIIARQKKKSFKQKILRLYSKFFITSKSTRHDYNRMLKKVYSFTFILKKC